MWRHLLITWYVNVATFTDTYFSEKRAGTEGMFVRQWSRISPDMNTIKIYVYNIDINYCLVDSNDLGI